MQGHLSPLARYLRHEFGGGTEPRYLLSEDATEAAARTEGGRKVETASAASKGHSPTHVRRVVDGFVIDGDDLPAHHRVRDGLLGVTPHSVTR